MIARVLPKEEWHRLDGTIPQLERLSGPNDFKVLVVEEEGEIVATWCALRVTHLEGLWCKPSHRGNAGVARRLMRLAERESAEWGASLVQTGAADPDVELMIRRHGGVKLEMDSFVMPLEYTRQRTLNRGEVKCQHQ